MPMGLKVFWRGTVPPHTHTLQVITLQMNEDINALWKDHFPVRHHFQVTVIISLSNLSSQLKNPGGGGAIESRPPIKVGQETVYNCMWENKISLNIAFQLNTFVAPNGIWGHSGVKKFLLRIDTHCRLLSHITCTTNLPSPPPALPGLAGANDKNYCMFVLCYHLLQIYTFVSVREYIWVGCQ